jgi:hypothetical protein
LLDHDRIDLYRDHRASERKRSALPQQPAKDTTGGPSPPTSTCRRHGGVGDQHDQHAAPHTNIIVTPNDALARLRRRPQWRLTPVPIQRPEH